MLSTKVGCLIEAAKAGEIDYLLQSCNCFSTQGAGVAKLISSNFPQVATVDKADYRSPIERIGSYSSVLINGLTFINLYCQYDYGTDYRRFEYGAFKRAMDEVYRDFSFTGKRIGLPMLGGKLGGADSELVKAILDDYTDQGTWTIYCL
jgi:hypothetical protein